MAGETPKADWKSEFQKANAAAKAPGGTAAPGATPAGKPTDRLKGPKFAIHDATVKLYRRGVTSIFGIARVEITGTVSELSEDVAEIVVGEPLMPDTKIHFRMEVARFNDRLESDAVVRLCRKDPKAEEQYQVRIEFVNPDDSLARRIAAMRGYFTSPEGRANLERRRREETKNRLFE